VDHRTTPEYAISAIYMATDIIARSPSYLDGEMQLRCQQNIPIMYVQHHVGRQAVMDTMTPNMMVSPMIKTQKHRKRSHFMVPVKDLYVIISLH